MIIACLALAFQSVPHEFVYSADRVLKSVSVAGTFNNWDSGANPMVAEANGLSWKTRISLPAGRYQYKFVLNGTDWITDPRAKRNVDDGNGNINSELVLLPEDYANPALRGDGSLATSALEHFTRPPMLNYDRGKLTLTFRTRSGDAEGVDVVVSGKRYLMGRYSSDDLYELYKVQIPWDRKSNLEYVFQVKDGKVFFVGESGVNSKEPFSIDAKTYQPFEVPAWVEGRVFYQIFPERFANGDKSNDPKGVLPWGSEPKYFNYMGGDLAGVVAHRDYLKKLGIGGIYLNPIFEGPSNHGYETKDYMKVDPRLGTNHLLADLVKEFHRYGIKVVLDGVFNHTATSFAPFDDIVKNGEKSKYTGWFWIHSYPVKVQDPPNYTAWFNFPSLPKVNLANPDARKFFLSVPGFWKSTANIDGWRLDVANEVDPDYWRVFRKTVKELDSSSWIVGEVWGDGGTWLQGDQWDSIMGYQFRDAVLQFVADNKISSTEFMLRLVRTYNSYAPQVSRNLMSLLSSHDTPRFITLCRGDYELAKLGAAIQMTWPGSPSIYYGEELGMSGGADPDNRRCMEWPRATDANDMLQFYRKAIALRMGSKALLTGEPQVLATDDQNATLSFARVEGDDVALVAVNRSESQKTISVPLQTLSKRAHSAKYQDALGSAPARSSGNSLLVTLGPKRAAVLLPVGATTTRASLDAAATRNIFSNPSTYPAGDKP